MTYVDRSLGTVLAEDAVSVRSGEDAVSVRPRAVMPPELEPLLSMLLQRLDATRSLVVNIASAQPGAGTSTVSRRLAEGAAATGWCRVALLDARPAPGEPGRGLVDAVERGEHPPLAEPPTGGPPVDAGRLSTGERPLLRIEGVRKLYADLRGRYALVIVDCPAVLHGQQTLSIAAAADETVLVVDAGRTALTDVAQARFALERRGASVFGMVMNKSRPRLPTLPGRLR